MSLAGPKNCFIDLKFWVLIKIENELSLSQDHLLKQSLLTRE